MMDDSPGNFTPLEIARNRLAKALFALCAGVLLFTITVGQSAKEFRDKETQLVKDVRVLDEVRSRLLEFIEPRDGYFVERLLAAFDAICLTPKEIGIANQKPGTTIVYGSSSVSAFDKPREISRKCGPDYVAINVVSTEILRPMARVLTELLTDERMSPETAIASLRQRITSPQKELLALLIRYWGVDGLAALIQQRWRDWRSMKSWVSDGVNPIWNPIARAGRMSNPGYTDYVYGFSPDYGLRRLTSDFTKQYTASLADRGRELVRVSSDASQALASIEAKATEARQDLKTHSPETKWSDVGIGGVSIPLLQWLEWTPWAVVALLALFVTFDARVQCGEVPESTSFWFPRLGRPRDPMDGPKPKGEQWIAGAFWLAFLSLPSVICYWAMVTRFQVLSWTDIRMLVWRDIGGNPVDWFSPVAFVLSLALTAYATRPTETVSARRRRDSKLVAYFCALTAAFAIVLIIAIHPPGDQALTELARSGRIYLVVPLIAIALLAFQLRKSISQFALILLTAYTGISGLILVRITT